MLYTEYVSYEKHKSTQSRGNSIVFIVQPFPFSLKRDALWGKWEVPWTGLVNLSLLCVIPTSDLFTEHHGRMPDGAGFEWCDPQHFLKYEHKKDQLLAV